jgi:hypothetical protein
MTKINVKWGAWSYCISLKLWTVLMWHCKGAVTLNATSDTIWIRLACDTHLPFVSKETLPTEDDTTAICSLRCDDGWACSVIACLVVNMSPLNADVSRAFKMLHSFMQARLRKQIFNLRSLLGSIPFVWLDRSWLFRRGQNLTTLLCLPVQNELSLPLF